MINTNNDFHILVHPNQLTLQFWSLWVTSFSKILFYFLMHLCIKLYDEKLIDLMKQRFSLLNDIFNIWYPSHYG